MEVSRHPYLVNRNNYIGRRNSIFWKDKQTVVLNVCKIGKLPCSKQSHHNCAQPLDLKAISRLIFILQYRQKSTFCQGEERMNCFPIMVFSFQSISFQAWFKKVPCQNLSLVDEVWDSSPWKVKIMSEANLRSSIWKPHCPLLCFLHSLSLFLSCQLEVFAAIHKALRSQNEKAGLNQIMQTQARKSFKFFSTTVSIFKFKCVWSSTLY